MLMPDVSADVYVGIGGRTLWLMRGSLIFLCRCVGDICVPVGIQVPKLFGNTLPGQTQGLVPLRLSVFSHLLLFAMV